MNQYELEVWQRPERNQYFQPSPTSYYETTRRRKYSAGAVVAGVVGSIGADGVLGWAAWSAHQACIHGNAHSAVAETVVAAASGASAVLAGFGFASKTERGGWAGTILAPVSLVLAGFGVLLWAPGWSASMVATLMEGVLTGGLAAVGIRFAREERKFNHEAGMQYDQIAGGLQKNLDSEEHKTERARIKHRAWFEVGYDADRRADRAVYDLHTRHPDIVAAPERYSGQRFERELPAGSQTLAITSGAEPVDDWMALANVLDEQVENR